MSHNMKDFAINEECCTWSWCSVHIRFNPRDQRHDLQITPSLSGISEVLICCQRPSAKIDQLGLCYTVAVIKFNALNIFFCWTTMCELWVREKRHASAFDRGHSNCWFHASPHSGNLSPFVPDLSILYRVFWVIRSVWAGSDYWSLLFLINLVRFEEVCHRLVVNLLWLDLKMIVNKMTQSKVWKTEALH